MLNVDPHEIYRHTVRIKGSDTDTTCCRWNKQLTLPFQGSPVFVLKFQRKRRSLVSLSLCRNTRAAGCAESDANEYFFFFTLIISCMVIQLKKLEPTKCTLITKPMRCTNFSRLFLEKNSTCFGQFLYP